MRVAIASLAAFPAISDATRAARHAARIYATLDTYGFHWAHMQMLRGAAAEVIIGRRSQDAAHHQRAVAEYFSARAPYTEREPRLARWLAAFEVDMCQNDMCQNDMCQKI